MKTHSRSVLASLSILGLIAAAQPAWAGDAAVAAALKDAEYRRLLLRLETWVLALLILLAAKAATVAYAYCVSEYAQRLFRRGHAVLSVSRGKAFLAGIVNAILILVIATGLGKTQVPLLVIAGVALLVILILGLLSSRALVYQKLGARLAGEVGDPESPPSARAHFLGGAAVELAFLAPLVGQLTMLVVTLTTFGALVLALLSRRRET